jgi:hypothetical protein
MDPIDHEPLNAAATPAPTLFRNVAAGMVAGAAGVISGHPFDTVKVRMQNERTRTKGAGAVRTFVNIVQQDKVQH